MEVKMTKAILKGCALENPNFILNQMDLFEKIKSRTDVLDNIDEAKLEGIFKNTKIDKRYTTMNHSKLFAKTLNYDERRSNYNDIGGKLAVSVARKAMLEANLNAEDFGQIITVSNTDFSTPGLDIIVMDSLGLPRNINRIPLCFQGCSAGLRGLAAAKTFCLQNPGTLI